MADNGADYAVFTTSRADRDLEKLPAAVRQRVEDAIFGLGDDPYPPGAAKLQGRDGYRIGWVITGHSTL